MKKWNNAEIVALDLNKTENGLFSCYTEGEWICWPLPHPAIFGEIPNPVGSNDEPNGNDQPTGDSGTTTDRLS